MTPEISEFSYGFSLTNEIVGWAPLSAAPIFPSLIEEGRAGGGYDVYLDMPGVPLYLQFKRADCMMRRSAQEIRNHRLPLSLPFYRFKITEIGRSKQHELLRALDGRENAVFYAAPRFHQLAQINEAWTANEVASRSIFVSPSLIGELDNGPHHIAYDDRYSYLCSEPKPIECLTGARLSEQLRGRLHADRRPFRDKISNIKLSLELARKEAEERIQHRQTGLTDDEAYGIEEHVGDRARPLPRVEIAQTRQARPLTEVERSLRDLADNAATVFNTQLIIVQEAKSKT